MPDDQPKTTIGPICGCDGYFDEGCLVCTPELGEAPPPPWTEAEKIKLSAQALLLDLKHAARLLREHGYTVTEPANV